MNNATTIQLQIEAYNTKDVEKFCSYYSKDIQIINFRTNEILINGMEKFREQYSKRFTDNPKMQCLVTSRMTIGDIVIDREHITGLSEGPFQDVVISYELIDEKIRRVWIIT